MGHSWSVRLVVVAAAALIAGSMWFSGENQQRAERDAFAELEASTAMLTALLRRDAALNDYIVRGRPEALTAYKSARSDFQAAVGRARLELDSAESEEIEALTRQETIASQRETLASVEIINARAEANGPDSPDAERESLLQSFDSANEEFRAEIIAERDRQHESAVLVSIGTSVGLVVLFGGIGYIFVERNARVVTRRRSQQADFAEVLQLARTESEAYDVLKLHLERVLRGARAVVLNRNNSADRLEARTALPEGSAVAKALENAAPASCLAIRRGKAYSRSPADESLLMCEICGGSVEASTCVPSLVGGEVIGSVLVKHGRPLDEAQSDRLNSAVAEAAPVIANLRHVAVAETRAVTDSLTGLPNARSVQETLKRMVAQAGRTMTPLAAVLCDLDHFKQVNDKHGHGKGDEVLAAVGDAIANGLRASDFAGRYGGEEFLFLLPDTDRDGALLVAEKLRELVAGLRVAGIEHTVSASFGVAVLPDEAADPTQLLRVADRALYTAKANGRNRVESAALAAVGA